MTTLPPDPRTTYDATDPVEDAPLAHKHALTRAVKRVIELSAHLDVDEVPDGTVEALTAEIDGLADRMGALASLHAKGGLGSCGGHQGALLERSGIAGRSNPLAAPVQWVIDDDGITRGSATYTAAYEGPVGSLHGGFVAAAFDDLLGSAQTASGIAGYTGTLTVRMIRPTPLLRRIDYEAGVDRVEGRKIFVWGTADCDGVRLAEAEIVFIAPARDGRA
ncbi:MAG: hypothetical protein WDA60_13695, partial [Acidimicrobiia bacterium]